MVLSGFMSPKVRRNVVIGVIVILVLVFSVAICAKMGPVQGTSTLSTSVASRSTETTGNSSSTTTEDSQTSIYSSTNQSSYNSTTQSSSPENQTFSAFDTTFSTEFNFPISINYSGS